MVDRRPAGSWLSLLPFLLLVLAVGGASAWVTQTSVGDWYPTLRKAWFHPPAAVFGPAWTVLYVMIAVAGWRLWRIVGWTNAAMRAWSLQLLLNLVWSFLFFGLRAPGLALIDILALLATILACLVLFNRTDRPSMLLFVPYVAWVTYAALLNASICWLNP